MSPDVGATQRRSLLSTARVERYEFSHTEHRRMHDYAETAPLRPQIVEVASNASLRGVRLAGADSVAYASRATGVHLMNPGSKVLEPVTLHISNAGPETYGDRTLWLRSEATAYDIGAAEDRAVLSVAVPLSRVAEATVQFDLAAGVAVEASPVARAAFDSVRAVLNGGAAAEWFTHSTVAIDRYLVGIAGLITSTILASTGNVAVDKRAWLRLQALQIVDARYDDPDLSLARIAAHVNVSVRSLHRAFEGHTGVAEVLRQRRIEHAAALLSDPTFHSMTINEISRRAGFWSSATFDRTFHSAYHLSPTQYRITYAPMPAAPC